MGNALSVKGHSPWKKCKNLPRFIPPIPFLSSVKKGYVHNMQNGQKEDDDHDDDRMLMCLITLYCKLGCDLLYAK